MFKKKLGNYGIVVPLSALSICIIISLFYLARNKTKQFPQSLNGNSAQESFNQLKKCEGNLSSYKRSIDNQTRTIVVNKYNFQISYPVGVPKLNKEPGYTEVVTNDKVQSLSDIDYIQKYQPKSLVFANGKYIVQATPFNKLSCTKTSECVNNMYQETVNLVGNESDSVCVLEYQSKTFKFTGIKKFAQNQLAIRLLTEKGGNLYEISYFINGQSELALKPIIDSDLSVFLNFVDSFKTVN